MDLFSPQINVTQLINFYKLFILCGNYSTILILYENSTIPILEPIVLGASDHSSIIFNIDWEQRNNSVTYTSEEHSLIIAVFEQDMVNKLINPHDSTKYSLKGNFHFLFVSRNTDEIEMKDNLMKLAVPNNLDNVGLIQCKANGTLDIYRIIYDQNIFIQTFDSPNNNCSIYNKMFYKKTHDLRGESVYVYVRLEPPHAINVTSHDEIGKKVISMGGRYAYLAELIPKKINITLKLCTVRISEYDPNNYTDYGYQYEFLKGFTEKTQEVDIHTATQLDYKTFVRNDDFAN